MYEYEEDLPFEALARYRSKLKLIGLQKCPYKIPSDEWINNPKSWPDVQYNDVYSYLIKFPRIYSREAMENWRSLEAHVFFTSGWVQTVLHLKPTNGYVIFRADVKPSWRVTEEPHHPWVALSRDGPVAAAHCDCMAGLGETCSHIGAMLFKMEAAVRLGYTAAACTDVPCQWNQCFVKNVQPSTVAQIRFYKQESRDRLQRTKTKRTAKSLTAPATEEEQNQFLAALASTGENIVGLSVFADYNTPYISKKPCTQTDQLPAPMRALYGNSNELLSDNELKDMCSVAAEKMEVTESEVAYVEETTRSQSSSAVWHEQRAGRITASVAQDMMRTDITNPAPSLVKKVCIPQTKPLTVPPIVWGNEHENDAFVLYSQIHASTDTPPKCYPTGAIYASHSGLLPHQECSVSKSGFVICIDKPFLGASPDGIVKCKCCGKGIIEIKCPYRYREKCKQDMLADDSCFLDQECKLKESHKYYAQMQLQMYVCGVSYGDMVVWTPVDCVIVRVGRNNAYISEMICTLESIWKSAILPELLTRKLERGTHENSHRQSAVPAPSSGRAYCKCQTTTDFEDMVGCDRCDNWFHRVCLKLKRLPTAKVWYCPPCRKVMRTLKKENC